MKPKILLVEDNLQNRILAEAILRKANLDVTSVSNGREALERLRPERFDLILLDIQLPEMDGYEVARRIREEEDADQKLCLVALTSYAMPGDRSKALKLGFDGYIEKPIDVERFVQEVLNYYQGKS